MIKALLAIAVVLTIITILSGYYIIGIASLIMWLVVGIQLYRETRSELKKVHKRGQQK